MFVDQILELLANDTQHPLIVRQIDTSKVVDGVQCQVLQHLSREASDLFLVQLENNLVDALKASLVLLGARSPMAVPTSEFSAVQVVSCL